MAKRSKLRITGFTRFFLVMLFVAPLAYIGASWYNGEDGIANIKKWFNADTPTEQVEERPVNPSPIEDRSTENIDLPETNYYKQRVQELEAENNRLRERIWELEKEVSQIRGE